MRIIGGNFKGKKVFQPLDKTTRPLKDLVKESIFNILQHSNKFIFKIEKSNVLDLFSGVGSFGIECLSRNVKFLTFVENHSNALSILKKNLNNLKGIKNFMIIDEDVYKKNCLNNLNTKFDLIFIDPPYSQENIEEIFELILEAKILKTNGILIIHRSKKKSEKLPKFLKIVEQKTYGISKIMFLKLV